MQFGSALSIATPTGRLTAPNKEKKPHPQTLPFALARTFAVHNLRAIFVC